jgi:hypothetical protein
MMRKSSTDPLQILRLLPQCKLPVVMGVIFKRVASAINFGRFSISCGIKADVPVSDLRRPRPVPDFGTAPSLSGGGISVSLELCEVLILLLSSSSTRELHVAAY